jgi:hypothetical protein
MARAADQIGMVASGDQIGVVASKDWIGLVPRGSGYRPDAEPIGFCSGEGLVFPISAHPSGQSECLAPDEPPAGNGESVQVWMNDPGDPLTVTTPTPNPAGAPAFSFDQKEPTAGIYQPGSTGFRYWTTVECLRRGGNYWARILGGVKWQTGAKLAVKMDEGKAFNAFYDRHALNFFHGDTPFGRVFSGESPDVACHEMGHAVLDSIKPELFDAASAEAAAFHEAFADISAMLSAIELPEMRSMVLHETGGKLYSNSRLSRLAEQLGAAIRLGAPQAVDPDCLRNAVNRFTYADPLNLPHSAPAAVLSSEPHSFSRVFSGAFLEALAGVLARDAGEGNMPTPDQLLATADRMAKLLIASIEYAPVVSNFFAQVAGGMLNKATAQDAPVLRAVFVGRSILSLQSSMQVTALAAGTASAGVAAVAKREPVELGVMALDARHYGVDKPLHLKPPGQYRRYEVQSSATDASSIEPASGLTAARSFTDDLVRRGRVRIDKSAVERTYLHRPGRFVSHEIAADESGDVRLRRVCFDCGLHWD